MPHKLDSYIAAYNAKTQEVATLNKIIKDVQPMVENRDALEAELGELREAMRKIHQESGDGLQRKTPPTAKETAPADDAAEEK